MSPNFETMKKRSTSGSINTQILLDFDLGESSDDSDFRIEDHDDESDDFSVNSKDDGSDSSDSDSDDNDEDENADSDTAFAAFKSDCGQTNGTSSSMTAAEVLAQAKLKDELDKATAKMLATPVCCACLGDRSDDTNEIVECDNCGISVHEGCYGISDSVSVSSTVSSCSTEPWFCEACKANILSPVCELCPNKGGIFKETDVGKWVHLVCALYVPGVAFGEVDHLSSVTLFEMQYNKWGAKTCSLCEDGRYARCGVCIGCDAGMCKTYFHVTCAQAAGLLSETHTEEADHADPFYAHCRIHSDKTQIKRRKRNFYSLKMKMEFRSSSLEQKKLEASSPEQQRIERKLKKHRNKYVTNKAMKSEPWVPTQKMPRLLSTSASACRRLIFKAELMGIDTAALEFQEAQIAALTDIRKKWHISPAFSVEFIGYYLDRITRSKEIKTNLQQQLDLNKKLANEQQALREKYDETIRIHSEQIARRESVIDAVEKLQAAIRALCPNKTLIPIDSIGYSVAVVAPSVEVQPVPRPMSVPTAAALKMGVGFPLTNLSGLNEDSNRILSTQCQVKSNLMNECGICRGCNDPHLLAKCDTCHLYYHLGCLNPPLTRHPKKSKIYGWQCSECDEDNPEGAVPITTGPRKSRTKYAKDGTIVPVDSCFDMTADDFKDDILPYFENGNKSKPNVSTDSSMEKNESTIENTNAAEPTAMMENISDSIKVFTSDSETKSPSKKKKQKKKSNAKLVDESLSPQISSTVIDAQPNAVDVVDSLAVSTPTINGSTNNEVSQINGIANDVKRSDKEKSTEKRKQKSKNNKKLKKAKHSEKNEHKATVIIKPIAEPAAEPVAEPAGEPAAVATDVATAVATAAEPVAEPVVEPTAEPAPQLPSNDNENHLQNVVADMPTNGILKPENEPAPESSHKHNRKRRKEKHRSKHGPEGKRSPSKEHKKKRKRKSHDIENPNASDGVPKIKIKFKAMPLPGETTAESHFFYVPADMVRPREFHRSRPVSVDSDELTTPVIETPMQPVSPTPPQATVPKLPSLIRARRMSILVTPPKLMVPKRTQPPIVTNQSVTESIDELKCDVCYLVGTPQQLVKCDECTKCYHFGCLMPPLKKTPKRRGYHWHCADCDPTDKEDN